MKKICGMLLAVLMLLTLMPATELEAAQYYIPGTIIVSPLGSDYNSGTELAPVKTIQQAVNMAGPGTTIYLRTGTYDGGVNINKSGTKDNYITITNYRGEVAKVTGNYTTNLNYGLAVIGQSYIKISGLQIGGFTAQHAVGILVNAGSHNVILENNVITNIVTSQPTSSAGNANAIMLYGQGKNSAAAITNVQINRNIINGNANGYGENIAIYGNCDTITVTSNQVFNNGCTGVGVQGNYGYASGVLDMPRNVTLTGNLIYSNGNKGVGVNIDGAYGVTMNNNTCNDQYYGVLIGGSRSNQYTDMNNMTHNISLVGNSINGNKRGGVFIGGETEDVSTAVVWNVVLRSNSITDNGGFCVSLAKCSNVTVTDNTLTPAAGATTYATPLGNDWATGLSLQVR